MMDAESYNEDPETLLHASSSVTPPRTDSAPSETPFIPAPGPFDAIADAVQYVGEAVSESLADARHSPKSKDRAWADGLEAAWHTLSAHLRSVAARVEEEKTDG